MIADAAKADERLRAPRYLIHEETTLAQVASDAVALAGRISSGRATAVAREGAGLSIQVADGEPVSSERSGGQSLSVAIMDQGRIGRASTGSFTPDAIRTVVEQAVFIAAQVEPDPANASVPDELLAHDSPDVPLYAPSGLSVKALTEAAFEIEAAAQDAAARQHDAVRVLETAVDSSDESWAHAIGSGFCRSGSASMQGRNARVIAERDGRMSVGHWYSADRRTAELLPASSIGATAVHHAVRKLGGRSIGTRDCAVLFDAPMAASLVGHVAQALFGEAQYRGATFLPEAMGQQVMSPHVGLIEDPTELFGMASGAFDGEGVAGSRRAIIREGIVDGYFVSARSARRLGIPLTGNAGGPWNLALGSTETRPDDDTAKMLRRLDRGLWVTELMGGGVDPVTGSYSRAAGGFWVEGGLVVHPVEDITIGGDLSAMLARIAHIGADVHRSGGIRTGSILIEAMRIAGR